MKKKKIVYVPYTFILNGEVVEEIREAEEFSFLEKIKNLIFAIISLIKE